MAPSGSATSKKRPQLLGMKCGDIHLHSQAVQNQTGQQLRKWTVTVILAVTTKAEGCPAETAGRPDSLHPPHYPPPSPPSPTLPTIPTLCTRPAGKSYLSEMPHVTGPGHTWLCSGGSLASRRGRKAQQGPLFVPGCQKQKIPLRSSLSTELPQTHRP